MREEESKKFWGEEPKRQEGTEKRERQVWKKGVRQGLLLVQNPFSTSLPRNTVFWREVYSEHHCSVISGERIRFTQGRSLNQDSVLSTVTEEYQKAIGFAPFQFPPCLKKIPPPLPPTPNLSPKQILCELSRGIKF